ncbi:hypothetical protein [Blastococcus sp. KM273128]|nr:hypothetical protein [Blastococcus sp. KM273128]
MPSRANKNGSEPLTIEDVLFTAADQFRDSVLLVAQVTGVSE